MRIAGIFPEFVSGSDLENDILDPYIESPLGIGYVLSSADKEGHESKLFIPVEESFEDYVRRIKSFDPDVLAFSLFTKHVPAGIKIASRLRKEGIISVVGRYHITGDPNLILAGVFDYGVIGEGEKTFIELLERLESGRSTNGIKGIVFRDPKGRLVNTGRRPRIEDVDSLPYPIRVIELGNVSVFGIYEHPSGNTRFSNVLSARGCPNNCYFCASSEMWQRSTRYRSVQSVTEEMNFLSENYGMNIFFFDDLSFGVSRQRVIELSEEIRKHANPEVYWSAELSIESLVRDGKPDLELIRLIAESRCAVLAFGLESLDNTTRMNVNKRHLDHSMVKNVLDATERHGIRNQVFYMIGFPWETRESILNGIKKLEGLAVHEIRPSVATPLPGSEWFKSIDKLSPDLSLYDTKHLVYEHPTLNQQDIVELQREMFGICYGSSFFDRMRLMSQKHPFMRRGNDMFLDYIRSRVAQNT